MSNYKAGLHKKVSSIFDGVPLQTQGRDDGQADKQAPVVQQNQEQNTFVQNQQTKGQGPVKKHYKDTAKKQNKPFADIANSLKARCLLLYQSLKNRLLPSEPGVNPTRQIASIILIPILSIVLIFVLIRILGPGSAAKRLKAKDTASSSATNSSSTIDWRLPQPYSAQLRDPMKIGASASQGAAGTNNAGSDAWLLDGGRIMLRGIVYGEDKANAIVGMQVVREGDRIGDITIVKINKNTVEFEGRGQHKILKVGQSWFLPD